MSKFTKEMVDKYAEKLLIGLTDDENKLVLNEFEQIDEAINQINEIENIKDVEMMTHALDDFSYVLREDVVEESTSIEELLQNCDDNNGEEPIVPKVVG